MGKISAWLRVPAAVFLSVAAIAVALCLPPQLLPEAARTRLPSWTPYYQVNLDLQGGSAVLLRLQPQGAIIPGTMGRTVAVLHKRLRELSRTPSLIAPQGPDRILVQMPYAPDPGRLSAILQASAKMTFQLVDENADIAAAIAQHRIPPGDELLPMAREHYGAPLPSILVKKHVLITGDRLIDAGWSGDAATGVVAVTFRLDDAGTKQFAAVTTEYVMQAFAVVLDGKVLTAPVIREPITNGAGQITGNFTVQSANDLAVLLRSGALPVPLTVVEAHAVAPKPDANSLAARLTFVAVVLLLAGLPLAVIAIIVHYLLWQPQRDRSIAAGRKPALSQPAAIIACYKNYFAFHGRARCSEYWGFHLTSVAVALVALVIDTGLNPPNATLVTYGVAYWSVVLVNFFPSLAVTVRRLHDRGKTGWWAPFALVPLIGAIVLIIWFCKKGTAGDNRFGRDPLA